MAAGRSHFRRAFDMLLTVHLREIIITFAWDETRLTRDRLEWRISAQKINDLTQAVCAISRESEYWSRFFRISLWDDENLPAALFGFQRDV